MSRITLAVGLAALALVAVLWIAVGKFGGSETGTMAPDVAAMPEIPDPGAIEKAANDDFPIDFETWQHMILVSEDLPGLMKSAMRITDVDLQNAVVAAIIDRWLVVDAAGFIRYLNALEVGGDKASLAVVALALQDSLTRLSLESSASDEILVVVQRLISYLASTEPETALEWARRFLLDDTLESSLVVIARGMARKDIESGLRIAESIVSPLRRSQAYAAIGTIWAAKDPAAALTWATSLRNHAERALTINSVLLVTAGQNLPAAARSLSAQARIINDQYLRERSAQLAALGMTEADLANDPDSHREMLESGALSAPSSPDVELMASAGKVIGSRLAIEDVPNAVLWAESLDSDFLKLTSLSGVLEGWASSDPVGALSYVSENHPVNMDLYSSIYSAWASNDPSSAATSAQQIPNSNQRAVILQSVFKVWATSGDSHEAARYLRQLPTSESTDAASYVLATTISYNQPEQAWRVAQSISDHSVQYRAMKSAFSVMVNHDPAAAAAVLATSGVSDETNERLSNLLRAVTVE